MKIYLYNMIDELNVINKTLSSQLELDCTLRDSCNILDPSIFIRKTNADGGSAIPSYNYAYIPEFNRYYFITDITSVNNQLWRIDMHVDVLMSYKDIILQQEVYVLRNENEYNKWLPDEDCLATGEVRHEPYPGLVFSDGQYFNATYDTDARLFAVSVYDGSYIDPGNPPSRPAPDAKNIFPGHLDNFISPFGITNTVYAFNYKDLQQFFNKLSSLDIPATIFGYENGDYVLSIKMYPFDISHGSTLTRDVYVNGSDMGIDAYFIAGSDVLGKHNAISKLLIEAIDMSRFINDFRDISPYSKYSLWLPYYGFIELDVSRFIYDKYLYIYLTVDYSTGKARYDLCCGQVDPEDVSQNPNLWSVEFNWFETIEFTIAVEIPVSFTRLNDMFRNGIFSAISFGLNMRGVGLQGTLAREQATKKLNKGGSYSKRANRIGKATEAVGKNDAISGLVSDINSINLRATISNGSSSDYTGWVNATVPYIIKWRNVTVDPQDYAHMRGRPLMTIKRLGDLTGFTLCGDMHLINLGNATSAEISEIEDTLTNGIIINPEE